MIGKGTVQIAMKTVGGIRAWNFRSLDLIMLPLHFRMGYTVQLRVYSWTVTESSSILSHRQADKYKC